MPDPHDVINVREHEELGARRYVPHVFLDDPVDGHAQRLSNRELKALYRKSTRACHVEERSTRTIVIQGAKQYLVARAEW